MSLSQTSTVTSVGVDAGTRVFSADGIADGSTRIRYPSAKVSAMAELALRINDDALDGHAAALEDLAVAGAGLRGRFR